MSDNLKNVYTGSRVEGLYLKKLLEENGIGYMIKDAFQSSIQAGWADGLPEDTIRILVEETHYDQAKKILDDYFASRDTK